MQKHYTKALPRKQVRTAEKSNCIVDNLSGHINKKWRTLEGRSGTDNKRTKERGAETRQLA